MKRIRLLFITSAFFIALSSSAQIKNLGQFTAGGVDDAQKLMTAYLTPWANALGTSLSGGWYNTAKVHQKFGFDLTITFNMGFVPADDKNFNLDDLNLLASYTDSIAPTAAGKNDPGPEIAYMYSDSDPDIELARYNTPKGTGLSFVPTPMIQAGIGLIKGTEIDVRYMPQLSIGPTGEVKLWGVGLKHDILQWIPGVSKTPLVHLSIQGGYTNFLMSKNLSFLPENIQGVTDNTTPGLFDGQGMELQVKSFTMNLLVSANLPVVCFYGGLGFTNTKTSLGLTGYYPVPTIEGNTAVVTDASSREIPEMVIENNDGSPAKPRINIGMRFKLGVITIHGDYTKANYSNVTAGVGISFK